MVISVGSPLACHIPSSAPCQTVGMFARAATSRKELRFESDLAKVVSIGVPDFSLPLVSDVALLNPMELSVGLKGLFASSTENVPQAGTYVFLLIIFS
jgi:hypothetical protein